MGKEIHLCGTLSVMLSFIEVVSEVTWVLMEIILVLPRGFSFITHAQSYFGLLCALGHIITTSKYKCISYRFKALLVKLVICGSKKDLIIWQTIICFDHLWRSLILFHSWNQLFPFIVWIWYF